MESGEYIEDVMHIGTKVGEFSLNRKRFLTPTSGFEEILEGDVFEEHTINVKNEIDKNYE